MYRCQVCGSVVSPRTPCHRLVVRTRPRQYPTRPRVHRVVYWVNHKRKVDMRDDPGGVGTESVVEVRACPGCALQHASPAAPAVVARTA
jgi:hypothetical protein